MKNFHLLYKNIKLEAKTSSSFIFYFYILTILKISCRINYFLK